MKKIVISLLSILIFNQVLISQEMEAGANHISIGIGPSVNYWNSYHSGGTPAIKFTYDHGYKQIGPGVLSFGGSLGIFTKYYKSNYYANGYTYTYKYNWTFISTVFRTAYHYNMKEADIPELNVYGGLGVGMLYEIFKYTYTGPSHPTYFDNEHGPHLIINLFLGANYFITSKTALYLEFGYDISYATIGVTFKL